MEALRRQLAIVVSVAYKTATPTFDGPIEGYTTIIPSIIPAPVPSPLGPPYTTIVISTSAFSTFAALSSHFFGSSSSLNSNTMANQDQNSLVASPPLIASITSNNASPPQFNVPSNPSSQTGTPVPSVTTSISKPTFTQAPSAKLSRSVQIGLGTGISLGGLALIALSAFLTYYIVRIRGRRRLDKPHDKDANPVSVIVEESMPLRQGSPKELSGCHPRRELDGTHWKRELPALPEHGPRPSEGDEMVMNISR